MITSVMVLDKLFDADFKQVFKGHRVSLQTLSNYISDTLVSKAEYIDYLQTINILKTCHVIADSYEVFKKRAYKCVEPFEDRDKFLVSLVLISLENMDSEAVTKYLLTHEDALVRAVRYSYKHAGLSANDNMRSPEELSFSEDVGKCVNGWDEYFYNVCKQVARNSKCFSRQIGAIIVRDKSIISTGYNGPPRGVPTCDKRWEIDPALINEYGQQEEEVVRGRCPRHVLGFASGEGLEICVAGHAERNSLINAARAGIATKNTIMYMTCGIPCSPCLVEIINAGIKEIVVTNLSFYDELNSRYLLDTSNLKVRVFDFIVPN